MINAALLALLGVFTLLFFRNVFSLIFGLSEYRQQRKRLKQLDINPRNALKIEDIMEKTTSPVKRYILPKFNPFDVEEIQKKLTFSGLDKRIDAVTFISLNIAFKILAVVLAIFFLAIGGGIFGIIWGAMLFLLPKLILDYYVDNKRKKILEDFPTFLRITQSYLSLEQMTIATAAQNAAKFVGEEWREIIGEFASTCYTKGRDAGLQYLRNSTGMFEVREFASILSIVMEKGGSALEAFEAQANNVAEMQKLVAEKKILKRKAFGTIIQAPMLISIFVAFGLPLIGDMQAIGWL